MRGESCQRSGVVNRVRDQAWCIVSEIRRGESCQRSGVVNRVRECVVNRVRDQAW